LREVAGARDRRRPAHLRRPRPRARAAPAAGGCGDRRRLCARGRRRRNDPALGIHSLPVQIRAAPGGHNSGMADDFMPLLGWDYVELFVGNAKQAAYFYEHAMGFARTAYCGPETGVRDRASYVLEQGDIRLVVTSALREESDITKHHARHGDGVKDIALTVPDATEAYRQAVPRGARGVVEPHRADDEFGSLEVSAIATYGDTIHTFVNRSD